jgi:hypothetical protein
MNELIASLNKAFLGSLSQHLQQQSLHQHGRATSPAVVVVLLCFIPVNGRKINNMKRLIIILIFNMLLQQAMAQCGTTINPPASGLRFTCTGADQYVTVPDNDDWWFNGDFGIEYWYYPNSLAAMTHVNQAVGGGGAGSSWYCGQSNITSGAFDFYSTGGAGWTNELHTAAATITANRWQHIAITRISGTVAVYINGVSTAFTGSVAATPNNPARVLAMGFYSGGAHLNGQMDELRIYRGAAPTQTELRDWMCKKMTASHPQWANCVGYWRFDEASGTTANDRKKCNNGTYTGTRTFFRSGAPVGDVSAWNYAGSSSTASIAFGIGGAGTDNLTATITGGTAAGVHVYGVEEKPSDSLNVVMYIENDRYGGVHVANSTNATYTLNYAYGNNPAMPNTTPLATKLYQRPNNGSPGWFEVINNISNNTGTQTFTATGQSTEYIIGAGYTLPVAPPTPNIVDAEAFIDNDPGIGNAISLISALTPGPNPSIVFTPGVAALSAGVHRLNVRVKQATGEWSHTINRLFYYEALPNNPLENIVKSEYFFDTDPGFGNATDIAVTAGTNPTIVFTPGISSLSAGLHRLYVRAQDAAGKWSHSIPQLFYYEPVISNPLQNIVKSEYFFDTDPGFGNATDIAVTAGTNPTIVFTPGISSLSAGLHRLYVRAQDASGKWSHSIPQLFYYEPVPSNPLQDIVKAEYFFDNNIAFGSGIDIPVTAGTNPTLAFTPTISSLSAGLHRLFVRTQDASGKWSHSIPQMFYYEPPVNNPLPFITRTEYFVDRDPGFLNATPVNYVADDTVTMSFTPSLTGLPIGLHRLFVRSQDANGKWSHTVQHLFYYEPVPNPQSPKIVQGEYFFDNFVPVGSGTPVVYSPDDTLNAVSFPVNITGLSNGPHRWFLRVLDENGKWSLTSFANITVSGAPAAPSIIVNSFTPLVVCSGSTVRLAFDATGIYNSGNTFTAQLSDPSGSFASPTILGSITGTKSGIISFVAPNLGSTNSYKLRIVSTNTAVTGVASDSSLGIIAFSAGGSLSDTTIYFNCFGDTYNLNSLYNASAGGVWNIIDPTIAPPGSYNYRITGAAGCSDTAYVTLIFEKARWTGAVSNNWHNAANWDGNFVPSSRTHVIIPNGTANPCVISASDADAASVQVRTGATFNATNNRKLTVAGKCLTLPPN